MTPRFLLGGQHRVPFADVNLVGIQEARGFLRRCPSSASLSIKCVSQMLKQFVGHSGFGHGRLFMELFLSLQA